MRQPRIEWKMISTSELWQLWHLRMPHLCCWAVGTDMYAARISKSYESWKTHPSSPSSLSLKLSMPCPSGARIPVLTLSRTLSRTLLRHLMSCWVSVKAFSSWDFLPGLNRRHAGTVARPLNATWACWSIWICIYIRMCIYIYIHN